MFSASDQPQPEVGAGQGFDAEPGIAEQLLQRLQQAERGDHGARTSCSGPKSRL